MVGKRIILILMKVLIERIELIESHPYIFVPIGASLSTSKHCDKIQKRWSMS